MKIKKKKKMEVFNKIIDITKLKEGDKILVHTNGFSPISWAIRVITHSYWNHIGDIVRNDGKFYVIEALVRKVILSPIEKYNNTKKYSVRFLRFNKKKPNKLEDSLFKTEKDHRAGIKININRAIKTIGKRYDVSAIAGLGIKLPARAILNCIPFLKRIPQINCNPLQFRKRVFCSENVCENAYDLLGAVTKNPFENRHKGQVCSITTPEDIFKSKYFFYFNAYIKRRI